MAGRLSVETGIFAWRHWAYKVFIKLTPSPPMTWRPGDIRKPLLSFIWGRFLIFGSRLASVTALPDESIIYLAPRLSRKKLGWSIARLIVGFSLSSGSSTW